MSARVVAILLGTNLLTAIIAVILAWLIAAEEHITSAWQRLDEGGDK